ncbi:hypothetical protein F2Q70_00035797 [Brassica cretica]|uniref:Uncharacterized protein n=1 Tax=Brassica cretica TaxID=69181 RepID=A0A8S9K154_BRACR|nr:hypothetical protein F2Q68_00031016 [Brassica cretica]KAF2587363.1 hypothetical protein F2Q70_00035797 [Brassica cretica]
MSIDRGIRKSIDTHHHQTNRRRASTDIAYYTSIDNGDDHTKEGDHSIGSWANDHYHESYAERSDTKSLFTEACGRGTRFYRPFTRAKRPSIDNKASTSIDNRPKANIHWIQKAMQEQWMDMHYKYPERTLQTFFRWLMEQKISSCNNTTLQSTRGELQTNPTTQLVERPEFGKRAYNRDGVRRFHWEQKDEYGVYRDDHGHARGVDGHIIHVSKDDMRNRLERASMDEHSYICLPEHERSFTQTKLVPQIYTKDEINEMLYGICGAHGKNEDDFQMKLDGVPIE